MSPPPPPPPPPPPSHPVSTNISSSDNRDALLLSIRNGCKLKTTRTVEKSSSSCRVGRVLPSSSSSSSSEPAVSVTNTVVSSSCPSALLATTSSSSTTGSSLSLHSLPGSPQSSPMMRRMTSRVSICSTTSTRRQAPAIPTCVNNNNSNNQLSVGEGRNLSRSASNRRSRVTMKPTAPPPPPPPPSSSLSSSSSLQDSQQRHKPPIAAVCRAQSMRLPEDCVLVQEGVGRSSADTSAYSAGEWRQQRRSVCGGSMRTAPPPPLGRPLKPPPPPPPRSCGGSGAASSRMSAALSANSSSSKAPPTPPVRHSSLTTDTVDHPRLSYTKVDSAVTPGQSGGMFARFEGQFRPLSSLPPPFHFTNCAKIYSTKTQLTSRRARAPSPPTSLQSV